MGAVQSRTDTISRASFEIPNLGGVAFPIPPAAHDHVIITLLRGCKRATGTHWHESHDEILSVLQGIAILELDGIPRIISKENGEVVIKRRIRHQYGRADRNEAGIALAKKTLGTDDAEEELEKDLVLRESTNPADGDKEVFFRNLLSMMEEHIASGGGKLSAMWMLWGLLVIFHAHDNYPAMLSSDTVGKRIQSRIVHSVLFAAAIFGGFVGLKEEYEEYTPKDLRRGSTIQYY
jgi:quercetin dioxygenase-like cupin family protein